VVLFSLEGQAPFVAEGMFVSPTAQIIGDVRIGTGCWVEPVAVIQADFSPIRIGNYMAIEENCVVHSQPEVACRIGDCVTIGQGAIVHGALIDDYATVGMGSVVGMEGKVGGGASSARDRW
jgi:carbonic anhydrase/acetyltransferase-like protein (isoleucine patch superfamily)